ncbi:MAG: hypothetical protein FJ102_17305 [Deltaproteobacteria bacterium]|nr:hypothetical protein [Deltaproteobacteria bacterium]
MLAASLLLFTGCNSYELFRVTGFEQATFNNNADIIFVIDTSGSMKEESSALALNFDTFLAVLTSAEGSEVPRASLGDAVNNYVSESTDAGTIIDYQLAITSTSADYASAGTGDVDPGEAGTLTGPVLKRGDAGLADAFRETLLCDTVYWKDADLATDASYTPGDDGSCPLPEGKEVTREYLTCLCGGETWVTDEGAGNEEGLESALDAICRAVDDPPEECFADDSPLVPADKLSNEGMLRADANTVIVIVSDEGDGSRRLPNTDPDITPYLEIFDQFPNVVRFAVIGPAYHDRDGSCLDSAQTWGVERYQSAASETRGVYIDLTKIDEDCTPTDWGENLTELGALLNNQLTSFPLQSIPDVATIRVYVDDEEVEASELLSGTVENGTAVWSDGWTYDAAENAVSFEGAAVPDYNADVRIYYRPLGGTPRELPI